jgi:hypothetical protein
MTSTFRGVAVEGGNRMEGAGAGAYEGEAALVGHLHHHLHHLHLANFVVALVGVVPHHCLHTGVGHHVTGHAVNLDHSQPMRHLRCWRRVDAGACARPHARPAPPVS